MAPAGRVLEAAQEAQLSGCTSWQGRVHLPTLGSTAGAGGSYDTSPEPARGGAVQDSPARAGWFQRSYEVCVWSACEAQPREGMFPRSLTRRGFAMWLRLISCYGKSLE